MENERVPQKRKQLDEVRKLVEQRPRASDAAVAPPYRAERARSPAASRRRRRRRAHRVAAAPGAASALSPLLR
jgi:hypothetical protein